MATPFADIETALNATATAALANATMIWGAYVVDGVFSSDAVHQYGVAARATVFRCLASALPAIAQAAAVSVDAVSYTVRAVETDATGLVTLILERA